MGLAVLLGIIISCERESAGKEAGLRTDMMVPPAWCDDFHDCRTLVYYISSPSRPKICRRLLLGIPWISDRYREYRYRRRFSRYRHYREARHPRAGTYDYRDRLVPWSRSAPLCGIGLTAFAVHFRHRSHGYSRIFPSREHRRLLRQERWIQ